MGVPSRVLLVTSGFLLIGAPAAVACSPQDYMSPADWEALSPEQKAENTVHVPELHGAASETTGDPTEAAQPGSGPAEADGTAPDRDGPSEAGLPTDRKDAAGFVRQRQRAPEWPSGLRTASGPPAAPDSPPERRATAPATSLTSVPRTTSPGQASPAVPSVEGSGVRMSDRSPSVAAVRPDRDVRRPSRTGKAPDSDDAVTRDRSSRRAMPRAAVAAPAGSAERPAGTATPATAADGSPTRWPLAALILVAGAVAAFFARRPRSGDATPEAGPTPVMPSDAVEAELQEILAERHADTMLSGRPGPFAAVDQRTGDGDPSPTATNSA